MGHHGADITRLSAAFYQAASRPGGWGEAWSELCAAFGAHSGLLFRQYEPTNTPEVLAAIHWSPEAPRMYAEHYMHIDPFVAAGLAQPGVHCFLSQEVVVPRDFERSEIYADFSRRHVAGAFHFLCAKLPLEGAAIAGVGLHRPREAEAFTPAERDSLEQLTAHLAAALRLERLLDEARAESALRGSLLDQLRHGVVVTDGAGLVRFANQAAGGLAAKGGLMLPKRGAPLAALNRTAQDQLQGLIAQTARGGPGGVLRLRGGAAKLGLAISITPLPDALAAGIAAPGAGLVLLSLRDLAATLDAGQAELMALFGLTGAEAAIVPQLVAGDSARLIAQSRGVAQATIRDQEKRILAKTGAANLRALAGMITALGCG